MEWIKLKDRAPDKEIDGAKVLLHRVTNDSQHLQSITVHDTHLTKYCDPEETYWMPLPSPPKQ